MSTICTCSFVYMDAELKWAYMPFSLGQSKFYQNNYMYIIFLNQK